MLMEREMCLELLLIMLKSVYNIQHTKSQYIDFVMVTYKQANTFVGEALARKQRKV